MIQSQFLQTASSYNDFNKALLLGDIKPMNVFINCITMIKFSFFDVGVKEDNKKNQSGFVRYDVILELKRQKDDVIIIEFKMQDVESENSLQDTVTRFAFCGKEIFIGKIESYNLVSI